MSCGSTSLGRERELRYAVLGREEDPAPRSVQLKKVGKGQGLGEIREFVQNNPSLVSVLQLDLCMLAGL